MKEHGINGLMCTEDVWQARWIGKIQWMQKGMELGEISSVHRNAQNEKQLGSFISYVELK